MRSRILGVSALRMGSAVALLMQLVGVPVARAHGQQIAVAAIGTLGASVMLGWWGTAFALHRGRPFSNVDHANRVAVGACAFALASIQLVTLVSSPPHAWAFVVPPIAAWLSFAVSCALWARAVYQRGQARTVEWSRTEVLGGLPMAAGSEGVELAERTVALRRHALALVAAVACSSVAADLLGVGPTIVAVVALGLVPMGIAFGVDAIFGVRSVRRSSGEIRVRRLWDGERAFPALALVAWERSPTGDAVHVRDGRRTLVLHIDHVVEGFEGPMRVLVVD